MNVIFDQLRVSDNGRMLFIDLHVCNASYFDNVTLDKLYIKTSKTLDQDSIWTEESGVIYETSLKGMSPDNKSASLVLACNDPHIDVEKFQGETFSDVLLFVYVKTDGDPDECTPCPLSDSTTLGVAFDENILYQKVMQYTKTLTQDCQVDKGFVDFILLWNAFKAAVETEHYKPAIKFYEMLMGEDKEVKSRGCGCSRRG